MSPAERANRPLSRTASPGQRLGRQAVARPARRCYLGGVRRLSLPTASAVLVATSACGGGGGGPAGTSAPAAPAPAAAPSVAPRLVLRVARVRGADLHFVERGDGMPVVLVHGSVETWDTWQPQIATFAPSFRVVAYSRRYHPPNAARADTQGYALALHADDLIGVIEALGLERVHLLGSSYGAYVALLAALRRPELVRSLVLEEPPLLPWLARTPAGDSLRRGFEETVMEPARHGFARGDSVDALRRYWDGVGGRPGRFDALSGPARTALARLAFELSLEVRTDPAVYMPMLSCAQVGRIRSPALVISGERSPRLFHLITDELTRCLPAGELVTVPGAGHGVHAESPGAYNAVVLRFLMRN